MNTIKKINPSWIILALSVIFYTLTAFAYIHQEIDKSTKDFVNKDTFQVFSGKIDSMDHKIDMLLNNNMRGKE